MLTAFFFAIALTAAEPEARPAPVADSRAVSDAFGGDAADVVVVCPEEFRVALAPWIEFRRQQGHRIGLVSNLGSTEQIRGRIRNVSARGRLRFIVLVGSAMPARGQMPAFTDDPLPWDRCVPMHYVKARVNVSWGSEPELSTDNWYAESDDSRDDCPRPTVAVGRLAVDTADELRQLVAKILAYERTTDFGPWRRQVNIVAGESGLGSLADGLIESSARRLIAESIPADYRVSMTYGNWHSPYCPDPRQFHATAIGRLNEGSLLWVYMGHGLPLQLDYLTVPGAYYPTLDVRDADRLQCEHGRPIALVMACYAGAADARRPCLAETMLRAPGGPVAVLAASRVAMPYGMTLLGTSLADEWFRHPAETLGETIMHAKQAMLREPSANDPRRSMYDAIALAASPIVGQSGPERGEHVRMFNLLGDPLLRIRRGCEISLTVSAEARAGQPLDVSWTSPLAGRATLELLLPPDRMPRGIASRGGYPRDAAGFAGIQEGYRRANDHRLAAVTFDIAAGSGSTRLTVPFDAAGACRVRLFVTGTEDFGAGSCELKVASATSGNGSSAASSERRATRGPAD